MPEARQPSYARGASTESELDDDLDTSSRSSRPLASAAGGIALVLGMLALVAVMSSSDVGAKEKTSRVRGQGFRAPRAQDVRGEPSCANYGCNDAHGKRKGCQCDSMCVVHKNCCADYKDVCASQARIQYKPAFESWSFEPEIAARPLMLAEGVYYDPKAPPPLYKDGCESDAGWTNGYENAASSQLLNENLTSSTGSAASATHANSLYTAEGFTCKAYAAGGWCGKAWALGPFANYPERHCCECGGGTTVAKLSASIAPPLVQPTPDAGSSSPSDKLAGCPRRAYEGPRGGPAFCFAQLAENSGVKGTGCGCRQGCDASKTIIRSTSETVAFANMKSMGWNGKTCARDVLLTIPREFYRDYADLAQNCGKEGMLQMVEVLMRDAWVAYNTKLCTAREEPLWQCFHSPRIASVPYIHMQTFSAYGFFHGMPTSNTNVGVCVRQNRGEETPVLARKLVSMM
eukprot:TRINITY_DN22590_c0_g1_i2.p1 TRINITY_DN22590_c0_g1~~TRINITY_DN22590_c0_g1_i2.p1  ORF type:complete len:460 (-),score=68.12 TRINITY_DN22590_c0_g1_i2:46-1425(-)